MKVIFTIEVDLDEGLIELDAKRRGRSTEEQLAEVVADCECRLHDSVRWRDSVSNVRSWVTCNQPAATAATTKRVN